MSFVTLSGASAAFWPSGNAQPTPTTGPSQHRIHTKSTADADSLISVVICADQLYVVDGDTLRESGEYTFTYIGDDGSEASFTLDLHVLPVFDTRDTLSICAGDTLVFGGDTLTTSGVYADTLTSSNGCDSVSTLVLNVLEVFETHLETTICAGSEYVFEGDTLTEAGTYSVILQSSLGCDSTVVLQLNVAPVFETVLEATICHGEAYIFNGDTLTVSGIYTDSLSTTSGCDSTIVLNLNVLPTVTTDLTASICAGETYVFGADTLKESGTYTQVLEGPNGCDSTLVLTLTVLPLSASSLEATVCHGEVYEYAGESLSESGTYQFVFSGSNGCDSTVTVYLTVLPANGATLDVTVCNGKTYEYAGEPLSESGSYEFVLTDDNGCDSTVVLHLTVLPELGSTENVLLCFGESFEFAGDTLSEAGIYTYVLSNELGCDSTVVLSVDVLPEIKSEASATICAGQSYEFGDEHLTEAGTYTGVFSSELGCDSTVTLTLVVLPTSSSSVEATICANETFNYNGQILDEAGTYEFGFEAANGCDSTVTLTLNVLPTFAETQSVTVCHGDTYTYNDSTLSASGSYEFLFSAASGCDSTVTVVLTVLPDPSTTFDVQLCEGESFVFGGETLTTSGTYTQLLSSSAGCDSLVTLHLAFLESFETGISATICAGETYEFDGEALSESGTYTALFTAAGGCDSLVTLTLTVNPTLETSTSASICSGDAYPFYGQFLTASGSYTANLSSEVTGCDSIVVLNLTVLPAPEVHLNASICAGETYAFNGTVLNESGTYTAVHPAASGCDSTTVLNLTVLPVYTTALSATICAGETFPYNGQNLNSDGVYVFEFISSTGCDSTVLLSLNVLAPITNAVSAQTCAGTPFVYNGQSLTAAGTYTFLFENGSAAGCDSTVTLTLEVLPLSVSSFDLHLCSGDSFEFGGQVLTQSGTYVAIFESSNGCDSTVTLHLTVEILNTGVVNSGGVLQAIDQNSAYQWVDCGNNTVIPGANSSEFEPTVTGEYAVVLTSPNGCVYTSDCYFVEVVGVTEINHHIDWTLQPNPAHDQTTVVVSGAPLDGKTILQVYDLTGRLLRSDRLISNSQSIDLSGLPAGVLTVRLFNEKQESTRRLVHIRD